MVFVIISYFIIAIITVNLEISVLPENENKSLYLGREVREVNVYFDRHYCKSVVINKIIKVQD